MRDRRFRFILPGLALAMLALGGGCAREPAAPPSTSMASHPAEPPPGRLVERLPVSIAGLRQREIRPAGDVPGNLAISYRAEEPGLWFTVYLLRPATIPLPEGAASAEVAMDVELSARALMTRFSGVTNLQFQRRPNFTVTQKGSDMPLLSCAEFLLNRPGSRNTIAEMVCATGIEGVLVKFRFTAAYSREERDKVYQVLVRLGIVLANALRSAAPQGEAPPPEGDVPVTGPLIRT